MSNLPEESPDFYRRRYEALKAKAVLANTSRGKDGTVQPPLTLAEDRILSREIIPAGWYATMLLSRGEALRLINSHATPGISVMLWNADDSSERFNHGDSVKLQWTVRLGAGKLLMSDMGRVLASIIADNSGRHDAVLGGSTPQSNERAYGTMPLRNARDNFLLAAGKHGLGPRDIASVMNLFAPVTINAAGNFLWEESALKPGMTLDLRAEMNLIVAVSNTPHPLAPGPRYRAEAIEILRWRPDPAASNACRGATEEAVRAFENTDAYFGAVS